ncbi:cytochrome ubiquinol oxidase subunit I [uncultured Alistipes sp.]|uniref:cytochrome ubiquinol oxidase subunit I n=1 Tax=uncultured Alistipes sp. TaxID=538949 RepID=UPI0025E44BDE|nr:cytochrome ubiquinol oxidase subunit I [uncultured Alistipes sp.]
MIADYLQTVDWSRAQFAMTAIYHWLFVPLTLGLAFIIAIMETLYVRTKDEFWKRTTKFWMRLFGINFAIGVATGIILEFEFGTNWSNYSHFVGDIFGAPLAVEGIMAFFMESTFIAIMFFGWNKVSKGFHLTATWLTAVGASLSALWILVANAWMQHPIGCTFNIETVRNEMTSFWDVLLSPVAINKFFHTVTSSYVLASLFVVGVSAWYLLRGREQKMARKSIAIASAFGFIFAVITATTGDKSGTTIARVQPMKLAAMEAHYDGSEGAPLVAVGVLRPEEQRTSNEDAFYFKVEIPKMLSVMSYHRLDAYVPGINDLVYGNEEYGVMSASEKMERGRVAIDELARYRTALEQGDQTAIDEITARFDPATPEGEEFLREYFAYFGYGYLDSPKDIVPNVPLLFYSFRVMVGAGCFFILLLGLVWWLNRKDKLSSKRWLLWTAVWSIPLAYIASQLGWVVAEVGRQPWAIQDLMPVGIAASKIGSTSVTVTFFIFLALFTALLIAELSIMFRQIKIGPAPENPEKE